MVNGKKTLPSLPSKGEEQEPWSVDGEMEKLLNGE